MSIRKLRKNIGKYLIGNYNMIYLIEDCFLSSRNRSPYFLLWNVIKHEYIPCMCCDVGNYYHYINKADANEFTLKHGYDCIIEEYFLTDAQKKELEKSYAIKFDD